MKIREASALIVVIALSLALVVQKAAYRRTIMGLENEAQQEKSTKIFQKFMQLTFGELGILVMKEPQEVRLYTLSRGIELDQATPKDILLQISSQKGEQVPLEFAVKVYNEFTPHVVDDQFSYFNPAPVAALKIVRNGDTVLLFSAKENGLGYTKIMAFDEDKNLKNFNYKWFKFQSAMIDKVIAGEGRAR